jgi:CRISPR-associated endonuclease Csy4
MEHYIDITLKPDAEMRENVLLNKVYIKLHKALHSLSSTEIGVSFPKYQVMLGNVIRLHGTESKLLQLQETNWLGGLIGYCAISLVQKVPENVCYRTVSRQQSNMTEAKLRRLQKRDSIPVENLKRYKAKMFQLGLGLDNAYLELESTSNGCKYRRYIQFGKLQAEKETGLFDKFGLSNTATIPWF